MSKFTVVLLVLSTCVFAGEELKDPEGLQTINMYLMFGLIFVAMWFFMIRPEQKKQKKAQEMRENIKKGEKIITAGGILGTIKKVHDDRVVIQINPSTEMTILKTSIGTRQEEFSSALEKQKNA
ncbi:MAG: preprotein translocase subunit YajC [Fibrobacterota bacterium]